MPSDVAVAWAGALRVCRPALNRGDGVLDVPATALSRFLDAEFEGVLTRCDVAHTFCVHLRNANRKSKSSQLAEGISLLHPTISG